MAIRRNSTRKMDALGSATEQIKRLVAQHGWAVLSVQASHDFPQFSYTVGLATKKLPELIVFGLDAESSKSCLNRVASRLVGGNIISNGDRLDSIIPVYPVAIRELSAPEAAKNLKAAKLFAGQWPLKAFQICWPDPAGCFPWESGYDTLWLQLQPMLGARH